MARILDFYDVRWEYEPTTFPILWNLDGEVLESFAPDFYLPELESFLEQRGKREQLDEIRKISRSCSVSYVRQGEPLGLGHAVFVARGLVGDESFAVILSDDVIDATPPALKQMIDVYSRVNGPVIAVERVPQDAVSSYGIVAIDD